MKPKRPLSPGSKPTGFVIDLPLGSVQRASGSFDRDGVLLSLTRYDKNGSAYEVHEGMPMWREAQRYGLRHASDRRLEVS